MSLDASKIIAIGIGILLLVIGFNILAAMQSNSEDQYFCLDDTYTIQSTDLTLCTNASYACLNSDYQIFNATNSLCTNSSGVGIYNESPTSGFSVYNESATYRGPSTGESLILVALRVIAVAGFLYFIYRTTITKKEN